MLKQIIALTRAVSTIINLCELTHLTREPIDVALARVQHRWYAEALSSLGCRMVSLST